MMNSPRYRAMRAARNRGWTLSQIAFAAGVSPQRVAQILGRLNNRIVPPRNKARRLRVCVGCGKMLKVLPRIDDENQGSNSCSVRCSSRGRRLMTEKQLMRALDLRAQGWTWKEISRVVPFDMQDIIVRAWRLLAEKESLTVRILSEIHRSRGRRHSAVTKWESYARATGLMPRDGGGETLDGFLRRAVGSSMASEPDMPEERR